MGGDAPNTLINFRTVEGPVGFEGLMAILEFQKASGESGRLDVYLSWQQCADYGQWLHQIGSSQLPP